jgi:hypothetical protein
MTTTESQAAVTKPRWHQYTLRTLLIAVTFVLMCVGYAAEYGLGTAIAFGVLTSLLLFWVIRAVRRWNTLRQWQRLYAAVGGMVLSCLLIGFIVGTATSPSSVRQRSARRLQRALIQDNRFSAVRVQYVERKGSYLHVAGRVDSDRDFHALRTTVLSYDWRNALDFCIFWEVGVASPPQQYDGYDEDLFSKEWQLHLGELRANCRQEIELGRGLSVPFKNPRVEDLQVLAWYRMRDDRPWYVDNALCWGKLTTNEGPRWVLVHMVRNPREAGSWSEWTSHTVFDAPNDAFFYFDKPPVNKYVAELSYFHFEPEEGWDVYDSFIDIRAWSMAFGQGPDRQFPKSSEAKKRSKMKE